MTTTILRVNKEGAAYPNRSAAIRARAKAIRLGWSNVTTHKIGGGRFEVVGNPPRTPATAEPAPPTKAERKTPTAAATPPAPKGNGQKPDGGLARRLKKDGTPAASTGVKGPRPIGVKSGLGVEPTWCMIFGREASKKKGQLNDAEITAEMQKNFPGRNSQVFIRVGTIRAKYNRGAFGFQDKAPSVKATKVNMTG